MQTLIEQLLKEASDLTDSQTRNLFYQLAGWLGTSENPAVRNEFTRALQTILPGIK